MLSQGKENAGPLLSPVRSHPTVSAVQTVHTSTRSNPSSAHKNITMRSPLRTKQLQQHQANLPPVPSPSLLKSTISPVIEDSLVLDKIANALNQSMSGRDEVDALQQQVDSLRQQIVQHDLRASQREMELNRLMQAQSAEHAFKVNELMTESMERQNQLHNEIGQ